MREEGRLFIQSVYIHGHSKLAELILQKSAEHNIDLNAKDKNGKTAFHFASKFGYLYIMKMLAKNSEKLRIDLMAKDNGNKAGFEYVSL